MEVRNKGGPLKDDPRVDQVFEAILPDPECNYPQRLAYKLKEGLESTFGGVWHCHVGPSFGSSFPYDVKNYLSAVWKDLQIVAYKYP
ncbi:hypothetical protein SprV_0200718900 [Sparganum proliferum]